MSELVKKYFEGMKRGDYIVRNGDIGNSIIQRDLQTAAEHLEKTLPSPVASIDLDAVAEAIDEALANFDWAKTDPARTIVCNTINKFSAPATPKWKLCDPQPKSIDDLDIYSGKVLKVEGETFEERDFEWTRNLPNGFVSSLEGLRAYIKAGAQFYIQEASKAPKSVTFETSLMGEPKSYGWVGLSGTYEYFKDSGFKSGDKVRVTVTEVQP